MKLLVSKFRVQVMSDFKVNFPGPFAGLRGAEAHAALPLFCLLGLKK
jgi:hypothetical protein